LMHCQERLVSHVWELLLLLLKAQNMIPAFDMLIFRALIRTGPNSDSSTAALILKSIPVIVEFIRPRYQGVRGID
jgi:hypothetical protein